MYWIYLILFVCIIFTPEVIGRDIWFLREDDVESILIFGFGLFGLLLFLGKESALMRTIREKLSLQQESNQIKKDLAQSYTYIGEINRHIDIFRTMVVESPHTAAALLAEDWTTAYDPIFEATLVLAQTDGAALVWVRESDASIVRQIERGVTLSERGYADGSGLLGAKKYWWQENGLVCVRANEAAEGVTAFLILRATKNQIEEIGVFQILVAYALLIFSLQEALRSGMASTIHQK